MGLTTPTGKPTSRADARISELTVALWVLVVLIAQIMFTCWWFARMYAT